MGGWVGGWVDEWMNWWVGGWVGGWVDSPWAAVAADQLSHCFSTEHTLAQVSSSSSSSSASFFLLYLLLLDADEGGVRGEGLEVSLFLLLSTFLSFLDDLG